MSRLLDSYHKATEARQQRLRTSGAPPLALRTLHSIEASAAHGSDVGNSTPPAAHTGNVRITDHQGQFETTQEVDAVRMTEEAPARPRAIEPPPSPFHQRAVTAGLLLLTVAVATLGSWPYRGYLSKWLIPHDAATQSVEEGHLQASHKASDIDSLAMLPATAAGSPGAVRDTDSPPVSASGPAHPQPRTTHSSPIEGKSAPQDRPVIPPPRESAQTPEVSFSRSATGSKSDQRRPRRRVLLPGSAGASWGGGRRGAHGVAGPIAGGQAVAAAGGAGSPATRGAARPGNRAQALLSSSTPGSNIGPRRGPDLPAAGPGAPSTPGNGGTPAQALLTTPPAGPSTSDGETGNAAALLNDPIPLPADLADTKQGLPRKTGAARDPLAAQGDLPIAPPDTPVDTQAPVPTGGAANPSAADLLNSASPTDSNRNPVGAPEQATRETPTPVETSGPPPSAQDLRTDHASSPSNPPQGDVNAGAPPFENSPTGPSHPSPASGDASASNLNPPSTSDVPGPDLPALAGRGDAASSPGDDMPSSTRDPSTENGTLPFGNPDTNAGTGDLPILSDDGAAMPQGPVPHAMSGHPESGVIDAPPEPAKSPPTTAATPLSPLPQAGDNAPPEQASPDEPGSSNGGGNGDDPSPAPTHIADTPTPNSPAPPAMPLGTDTVGLAPESRDAVPTGIQPAGEDDAQVGNGAPVTNTVSTTQPPPITSLFPVSAQTPLASTQSDISLAVDIDGALVLSNPFALFTTGADTRTKASANLTDGSISGHIANAMTTAEILPGDIVVQGGTALSPKRIATMDFAGFTRAESLFDQPLGAWAESIGGAGVDSIAVVPLTSDASIDLSWDINHLAVETSPSNALSVMRHVAAVTQTPANGDPSQAITTVLGFSIISQNGNSTVTTYELPGSTAIGDWLARSSDPNSAMGPGPSVAVPLTDQFIDPLTHLPAVNVTLNVAQYEYSIEAPAVAVRPVAQRTGAIDSGAMVRWDAAGKRLTFDPIPIEILSADGQSKLAAQFRHDPLAGAHIQIDPLLYAGSLDGRDYFLGNEVRLLAGNGEVLFQGALPTVVYDDSLYAESGFNLFSPLLSMTWQEGDGSSWMDQFVSRMDAQDLFMPELFIGLELPDSPIENWLSNDFEASADVLLSFATSPAVNDSYSETSETLADTPAGALANLRTDYEPTAPLDGSDQIGTSGISLPEYDPWTNLSTVFAAPLSLADSAIEEEPGGAAMETPRSARNAPSMRAARSFRDKAARPAIRPASVAPVPGAAQPRTAPLTAKTSIPRANAAPSAGAKKESVEGGTIARALPLAFVDSAADEVVQDLSIEEHRTPTTILTIRTSRSPSGPAARPATRRASARPPPNHAAADPRALEQAIIEPMIATLSRELPIQVLGPNPVTHARKLALRTPLPESARHASAPAVSSASTGLLLTVGMSILVVAGRRRRVCVREQ